MHDGLGQLLTAVSIHINALNAELSKKHKEFLRAAGKIKELNNQAISEARAISHGLMSSFVKKNGLLISIHEIAHQFSASTEVDIEVDTDHVEESDFTKPVKLNLYRITQELVTNTLRHAEATKIKILLEKTNKSLVLKITDDGKGISQENQPKKAGFGLINVNYRVQLIKGNFDIQSANGKGTSFVIRVPVDKEPIIT